MQWIFHFAIRFLKGHNKLHSERRQTNCSKLFVVDPRGHDHYCVIMPINHISVPEASCAVARTRARYFSVGLVNTELPLPSLLRWRQLSNVSQLYVVVEVTLQICVQNLLGSSPGRVICRLSFNGFPLTCSGCTRDFCSGRTHFERSTLHADTEVLPWTRSRRPAFRSVPNRFMITFQRSNSELQRL